MIDATLTMLPLPCSSIDPAASREQRKHPVRLTSITFCQSLRGSSVASIRAPVPALLTRTSIEPWVLRTTLKTLMIESSSETSISRLSSSKPLSPMDWTALRDSSRLRSPMTTLAPASKNLWAAASPIPLAPPVTNAVRSVKENCSMIFKSMMRIRFESFFAFQMMLNIIRSVMKYQQSKQEK